MNKSWLRQVVVDTKECGTERDLERKKNAEARPHCWDFSEDRIKLVGWQPRKMGVWADSPDFTDFAALEVKSFIRYRWVRTEIPVCAEADWDFPTGRCFQAAPRTGRDGTERKPKPDNLRRAELGRE